jgi:hypothetical protein
MGRRIFAVGVAVLLLLAGTRGVVSAQQIAGGVSFLTESNETAVGVSGDIRQHWFSIGSHLDFGIVVDGGYHKFQGFSVISGQGGPRITWQGMSRVRPYGQVTAGFEYCHLCEATNLVTEPNVGVDVPIGGTKFNVRASYGMRSVWVNGGTFTEHRFWLGVSLGR